MDDAVGCFANLFLNTIIRRVCVTAEEVKDKVARVKRFLPLPSPPQNLTPGNTKSQVAHDLIFISIVDG